MKLFLDFLPLFAFFLFYKLYDLRSATVAIIIASALVLIYGWYHFRKLQTVPLISFVMIGIFGTITVYFNDITYLVWKVTLFYLVFSAVLLISQWWLKVLLIQRLLQKEIKMPESAWYRLNIAWALFFLACGLANYLVASYMSQDVWVNFKVFGLIGITLIFSLLTGIYIFRNQIADEKTPEENNPSQ